MKVSICIPVYNGEKYLPDCIESAMNQTETDIEILLADDGSTDGSIAIIKQYQQQDGRIKLIQNKKNLGLVGNWNNCLTEAKADWIKFLFQDDMLERDCVEKMLSACITDRTLFAVCGRRVLMEQNASDFSLDYFANEKQILNKIITKRSVLYPYQLAKIAGRNLLNNFIGEPITLLFHKDVIKQFGLFNEDLVQLVDYEFALRVALNINISFLPEPLVIFRVHSAATSNKQTVNETKRLRSHFIDYILLLHEQLYNPLFKRYKKGIFRMKHLRFAIAFYQSNKPSYKNADAVLNELSNKYKYLKRFHVYSLPYGFVRRLYFRFVKNQKI